MTGALGWLTWNQELCTSPSYTLLTSDTLLLTTFMYDAQVREMHYRWVFQLEMSAISRRPPLHAMQEEDTCLLAAGTQTQQGLLSCQDHFCVINICTRTTVIWPRVKIPEGIMALRGYGPLLTVLNYMQAFTWVRLTSCWKKLARV